MNAANEEAVALYLQDQIGFYDIPDAGRGARCELPVGGSSPSLDDILEADSLARDLIRREPC